MEYLILKSVHVSCVALSYALFVVRGLWMIRASPRLQQRWVRIAPHVVDTALLASAIALTLVLHEYPFASDWLTAKVLGLILYVVLGTLALKRGRSRSARILAWIAAQLTFFYIVLVAITHHPLPLYQLP